MKIFNKILDIIENIKLKINDNEYIEIMNELKKIRDYKKWYEYKCIVCKDIFPSKNPHLKNKSICENCTKYNIYSSDSSLDDSDTIDLNSDLSDFSSD